MWNSWLSLVLGEASYYRVKEPDDFAHKSFRYNPITFEWLSVLFEILIIQALELQNVCADGPVVQAAEKKMTVLGAVMPIHIASK